VQFPIGFYMVYRGKEMAWTDADGNAKVGLWDSLTNLLYSSHKTLGVVILVLIALRLIYRFTAGSPGHEVTLSLPQKIVSTLTHWAMYVLLLAVPILGYVGISLFPALKVFGAVELPAVTAPDKDLSQLVFEWHELAATVLLALVALHVAAAIYHHFVRRDYVLARMVPALLKRRA